MKDSLPKLTEKAQKVFNAWVRRRDTYMDQFATCISCERVFYISTMDAGHYVPVRGGSFLRFHEWNVNAECKGCNGFDDFHLVGYRKNLIEKIGLENVEWLEANRRTVKKWSMSELLEIIEKYKP
jgi:hypothetical protein